MKRSYTPPPVNFQKVRKSYTVPDQSLSIKEIVERYVRGLPVDVVQRQGVYADNEDVDLEKLSRMDFADKAAYAEDMRREAAQKQSELDEAEAAKEKERIEAEKRERQQAPPTPPPTEKGGSLA